MDIGAFLDVGQGKNLSDRIKDIQAEEDVLSKNIWLSIAYIGFFFLVTFVGIIGNILVIGAVFVTKSLRTTANVFIVNLALADLGVSAVVDPFSIVGILVGHEFFLEHEDLCILIAGICLPCCICSTCTISAIAVNRYIYLCQKGAYHKIFTYRKSIFICFLLWGFSWALESPNFWGWGGHTFDKKSFTCLFDRRAAYSYTVFFVVLAVGIPLTSVVFSYWGILGYFRQVKKDIETIGGPTSSTKGKEKLWERDDFRLARTLFVIFVVFLICWAPYATVIVADINDEWPDIVYAITLQMAHTNSSINCILYAATNKRFREGYYRFMCCFACRQNVNRRNSLSMSTTVSYASKTTIVSKAVSSTTVNSNLSNIKE